MDPEVGNKEMRLGKALLHFSAGAAVGSLLGFCMGLSVSPVVATVLTAIGAGLLALLGLKGSAGHSAAIPLSNVNSLRVSGFGFFAVIGLVAGLLIRTHGWLSPSLIKQRNDLKEAGFSDPDIRRVLLYRQLAPVGANGSSDLISQREDLKEAGFSDSEVHDILLYRELGLGGSSNPDARQKSDKPERESTPKSAASVLPSSLYGLSADECLKLDLHQYADTDAFIASLRSRKGKYEKLAASLSKLSQADREVAAQAFYEFSCR